MYDAAGDEVEVWLQLSVALRKVWRFFPPGVTEISQRLV